MTKSADLEREINDLINTFCKCSNGYIRCDQYYWSSSNKPEIDVAVDRDVYNSFDSYTIKLIVYDLNGAVYYSSSLSRNKYCMLHPDYAKYEFKVKQLDPERPGYWTVKAVFYDSSGNELASNSINIYVKVPSKCYTQTTEEPGEGGAFVYISQEGLIVIVVAIVLIAIVIGVAYAYKK